MSRPLNVSRPRFPRPFARTGYLMQVPTQGPADAVEVLSRTVVVIDMVGYSSTARLLEENMGAGVVSDLNRQIQAFIGEGFAALPDDVPRSVVSTTGD